MARVLFVCLHKAGRFQMSQAFFARMAQGHHEARSAGTTPAELVLPEVIRVMREVGIDLSSSTPQKLPDELAAWADVVVTMGAGMRVRISPANGTSTGNSRIRMEVRSLRCVRSGTEIQRRVQVNLRNAC